VRWLLVLLGGCTTLSTLDGARTLPPGATQWTVAASLQRGANPLSGSVIPLPQVEGVWRRGLAEDVDFGVRLYLLGVGTDARYRFLHEGPLHLAVQPGLFLFFLPTGGAGSGSVEVRAPLTAEYELSDAWSVAGGGRVFLREQWNSTKLGEDRGVATRLDTNLGGALRLEYHTPRFGIGYSVDLYGQQARAAPLAWSTGIDFQFRKLGKER
jgi:hypothetical protein